MNLYSTIKVWLSLCAYLLIGVLLNVRAEEAADWKDFYVHKDSTIYAAHRSNLPEFRKETGAVKVWVRMTCSEAKKCPVREGKVQWIANCGKQQLAVGRSIFYAHDGKVQDGGDGTPESFKDIAPGTISTVFYELVCEK